MVPSPSPIGLTARPAARAVFHRRRRRRLGASTRGRTSLGYRAYLAQGSPPSRRLGCRWHRVRLCRADDCRGWRHRRWRYSCSRSEIGVMALCPADASLTFCSILVPVYILLLEFPVKHAIPLASATVFGGAIANNILNAPKRHPDHPHRPVIDWDLILQLEPMTILGALVGAVLNDLLPDIVLVTMMVLLLTITAQKTLSKASKLYAKASVSARPTSPLLQVPVRQST